MALAEKNFIPKKFKKVTGVTKAVNQVTPEDHLLRQFALLYLVDHQFTVREVARKLNTTPSKIKKFVEDEEFREELRIRMERVHGIDTDYMQDQSKLSLSHLYEELQRRHVTGKLEDVSFRDLHRMIIENQKELRLDTPGAFTSKVGVVADLDSLQDRYKKSLSGKINHRKQKRIKNVTPKKVTEESNSVGESKQNKSGGSR